MLYDAVIIGGGPAGCTVAQGVATRGFRVLVVEEHPVIGEPLQCAGLISPRTLAISGVGDGVVCNVLSGAAVHSPWARLEVSCCGPRALVVDRAAFDRCLADGAREAGADFWCGARAVGIKRHDEGYRVLIQRGDRLLDPVARLVVGADGAYSKVAGWLGLLRDTELIRMYAAEVRLSSAAKHAADIFIGRCLAPGWFGWIAPVDHRRARVGIGTNTAIPPGRLFKGLAAAFPARFSGMDVLRCTGGNVPVGLQKQTFARHAMLVGDAAGHVKPISGGGLHFGLLGAEACATVAGNALASGDLSAAALSLYQRRWMRLFGGEIRCGMHHRHIFLKLGDRKMDHLLAFLNKDRWLRVIEGWGDIDYPSLLAGRLFRAGPWARKFPWNGGEAGRLEASDGGHPLFQ